MSEEMKNEGIEPVAVVSAGNNVWTYDDWREAFTYPEEYFDAKRYDIIIKEKLGPIFFIFDDLSVKRVKCWWRIERRADPMKISDELVIEGAKEIWMEYSLGEKINFEQLPSIIKKKIKEKNSALHINRSQI